MSHSFGFLFDFALCPRTSDNRKYLRNLRGGRSSEKYSTLSQSDIPSSLPPHLILFQGGIHILKVFHWVLFPLDTSDTLFQDHQHLLAPLDKANKSTFFD
eukprot:GFKZ01015802.1.p2 GENE.GFKZ01015802.1~~GFKZ01015802.1.p2  ORF type:complete len:100 (-),score=5.76 GFKZ01015802.1:955-1254(-)